MTPNQQFHTTITNTLNSQTLSDSTKLEYLLKCCDTLLPLHKEQFPNDTTAEAFLTKCHQCLKDGILDTDFGTIEFKFYLKFNCIDSEFVDLFATILNSIESYLINQFDPIQYSVIIGLFPESLPQQFYDNLLCIFVESPLEQLTLKQIDELLNSKFKDSFDKSKHFDESIKLYTNTFDVDEDTLHSINISINEKHEALFQLNHRCTIKARNIEDVEVILKSFIN